MILLIFAIYNLLHNPLLYAYTFKLYAWEYLGNKVTLRILYKIYFVCLSGKNKRITTNLASKLNLLHNPLLYAYTFKLYAWEYLGNKVTLRILYKIYFVCLSGKNKRITTNLASKLKIIFAKHCSLTVEMIRSH